ncbi:hypothetical protein TB1_021973 [Malus domestica]
MRLKDRTVMAVIGMMEQIKRVISVMTSPWIWSAATSSLPNSSRAGSGRTLPDIPAAHLRHRFLPQPRRYHQDLKPKNFLLDQDDNLKVTSYPRAPWPVPASRSLMRHHLNGAASNMKGGKLSSQALMHDQFAAAQSSGPHQLVPAGFPYVHAAVPSTVQPKKKWKKKQEQDTGSKAKSKVIENFKVLGVNFVLGDLYDHESSVNVIKQVDVVISTVKHGQSADQGKIITYACSSF